MNNILYESALETYEFAEKNKKHIINFISMFLPKETKEFIFNNNFNMEDYSGADLKSKNKKNKKSVYKKKGTKTKSISLYNSLNKEKIKYAIQFIPDDLISFIMFFSYATLHNIYFWSVFIIILFVTKINYLIILLLIILVNTLGIVFFSNCPISILEKKYRNKIECNDDFLSNMLKHLYDNNINNNYSYEYVIEQLIFTLFLIFIKICLLMLYRYFTCR
jgi:hypothetical protein